MKAEVANETDSQTQLKGWKRGRNECRRKIYPAVIDHGNPPTL